LDQLRAAARAARVKRRWERRLADLPAGADGARRLHIGCGDVNAPGFINLDARALAHVHIVHADLSHLPMIPAEAFELVYLSHVLEHVERRRVTDALRELRRILEPGGLLRISVPDFDKLLDLYLAGGRAIGVIEGALMGGQDRPDNYHHAVFNAAHLRAKLCEAGFSDIREWDPDNCAHHDFDDWASRPLQFDGRRFPISLNMEAVRPR
jgi:predicted SAM-dependent methyltransferase